MVLILILLLRTSLITLKKLFFEGVEKRRSDLDTPSQMVKLKFETMFSRAWLLIWNDDIKTPIRISCGKS